MPFPRRLKDLCTPALLYFVISIIGLAMAALQNIGNQDSYTLGSFSCRVPNTAVMFILQLIYILFWTWVLNLICKDGHVGISWLLVLFPFILLFVLIAIIMMNG